MAWRRLESLGASLPALISDRLYLETRLASDRSRADLIIAIEAFGREILAGKNPALFLPPVYSSSLVWAWVREVCGCWSAGADAAFGQVRRLWLEFDLPTDEVERTARLVPGIFVDLCQPSTASSTLAVCDALLGAWHRCGSPGRLLARTADSVSACLRRLPDNTSVFSLGLFPSRGDGELRLCVYGVERSQLGEVARALPWPGPRQRLIRWLEEQAGGGGSVCRRLLHLDLTTSAGPRIGFEWGLRRAGRSHEGVLRDPYLRRLVAAGLCADTKYRALCTWPETRVQTLPHELWPSLVVCWVNHLKVTLRSDGHQEAKAYLCRRHVPHFRRKGCRAFDP